MGPPRRLRPDRRRPQRHHADGRRGRSRGPTDEHAGPAVHQRRHDYVPSWLATTSALATLMRRATDCGSYRVTLNLTRIATWILSLGVFDRDYAQQVALSPDPDSPHAYLDPGHLHR